MGLDRRLREALHEHASSIEPDTHGRLDTVMRRGGPRNRWGGVLAGAAAAVLLLAVAGTMLPLSRQDAVLTGTTWTVTLEPDDPGVADLAMAGTWSLQLGDRSTIALSPPPTFIAQGASAPDGYVYTATGAEMTTNLFSRDHGAMCAGPATYAVSIDGDRLTFIGSDSCPARAVLLETRAWTAVSDSIPMIRGDTKHPRVATSVLLQRTDSGAGTRRSSRS